MFVWPLLASNTFVKSTQTCDWEEVIRSTQMCGQLTSNSAELFLAACKLSPDWQKLILEFLEHDMTTDLSWKESWFTFVREARLGSSKRRSEFDTSAEVGRGSLLGVEPRDLNLGKHETLELNSFKALSHLARRDGHIGKREVVSSTKAEKGDFYKITDF